MQRRGRLDAEHHVADIVTQQSTHEENRAVSTGLRIGRRLLARWVDWIPNLFVLFALAALVVAPWAVERYLRPLNVELRDLGERGRGLITRVHVALALQASTFHEYVRGQRPELLENYRVSVIRERAAYDSLAPIAIGLGHEPKTRLAELRELEQEWHASVDRFVDRVQRGQATTVDPLQEETYDDLLLAAARLDEAINQAAQDRRIRIESARALQRSVSGLLGVLAIAAAIVVWRLGIRVREYAEEAEQQRGEVEAVMRSKARLMRGVTHDLKNPLQAIDGHAQLMQEGILGPLSAAQIDSVGRVRRAVRTMLALIEDLIELARVESGQIALSLRRVQLAEVVREAVDDFRPAAEARRLRLDLSIPDPLPEVSTDPHRVGQVLGNLLSNAVKYTPPGGHIGVRVGVRDSAPNEGRESAVAIEVADDGPGIPRDRLDAVFQEFYRLEGSDQPGAGLGLAIGRRVARLLGGDITADSDRGTGARFVFWLPNDTH
jgi:signal transduction histidine kinase